MKSKFLTFTAVFEKWTRDKMLSVASEIQLNNFNLNENKKENFGMHSKHETNLFFPLTGIHHPLHYKSQVFQIYSLIEI